MNLCICAFYVFLTVMKKKMSKIVNYNLFLNAFKFQVFTKFDKNIKRVIS